MLMHPECMLCNLNQVYRGINLMGLGGEVEKQLVSKVLAFLSEADYSRTNSHIMGETWKLITKEIGDPDPYAQVKEKYNTLLLQAESELRNAILQVENSFLAALRLAVAGNQIDFAGRREVSFILKEVYHCMEQELVIDDSTGLLRELEKTRKLLYLGDNCGEIVLDKLFIEMIRKRYPNLTVLYGVRGRPVVNDVTLEDARMVGMERVARIIENGSGALGTVLNETSPEFQEIFKTADLVISKGQGNFESLSECRDQQIYYLLMIKCERVSRALKGPVNGLVCMRNPLS